MDKSLTDAAAEPLQELLVAREEAHQGLGVAGHLHLQDQRAGPLQGRLHPPQGAHYLGGPLLPLGSWGGCRGGKIIIEAK